MWNAQTEMLLEKTIYLLPTELTVWRGADEAEQVDNTMAFSLLVAAAAEAAFGSPISTDLDLATPSSRDRTHTPGETLLPILSPSPHRTAPLIRDQLTLWNSFEQPPHLQHPCHFTWGLYMGMRTLHGQHLPLVRSFWSARQFFFSSLTRLKWTPYAIVIYCYVYMYSHYRPIKYSKIKKSKKIKNHH